MTKLMIVIHSLKGGGSERVLINILKGLDRQEFAITLVLYESVFDFPLPEGIEVEILDIQAGTNIIAMAIGFLRKIARLSGLIKKISPDKVFSLLSSTNVTVILAKMFSGRQCGVIISEHTHPSVNLENEKYGGITKKFMRYVYPKADNIIAVSEGIKQDLIKSFKLPDNRINVIYNPVDLNEIRIRSQEKVDHPWFYDDIPVITSMGRLTKQKGYPYLLKAFSLARRSLPCRLMIIGEGEDKEQLMGMAHSLDIDRDVAFVGFQANPFQYMAKSSVFVLSSLYEGFGNVIVEAMALGLPVISTDCPSGPAEIIDDQENGILVAVRDEQALAQAVLEVLTKSEMRFRLSNAAKRKAEVFALEKIVKDYRRIFSENSSYSL